MKFLSALVLTLVFSLLTVLPAYCDDAIVNEDQMIGVAAGKVWNQRDTFEIEQVNVNEGEIEIVIVEMSPETEAEIRKIVEPYEVSFLNQKKQGRDGYARYKNFILTEGKNDVECEGEDCKGLIFQLQNAPYVSNGFLMIPLRQVFTMLDDNSDCHYNLKWVGGNGGIIEVLTNSGLPIQLSCKNNTITIIPYDEAYSLDGKIEVRDGVAYFPCSLENLRYIVPSIKITQDIEEKKVEIMS